MGAHSTETCAFLHNEHILSNAKKAIERRRYNWRKVVIKVLHRCERLMLASRRAKKRVSALDYMRLRSDVATIQHLAPFTCSPN